MREERIYEEIYKERFVKKEATKKSASLKEERLYKQSKIAFTSDRDGNDEIYIMNPGRSEQKRLTNNPAMDVLLSWYLFLPSENKKGGENGVGGRKQPKSNEIYT